VACPDLQSLRTAQEVLQLDEPYAAPAGEGAEGYYFDGFWPVVVYGFKEAEFPVDGTFLLKDYSSLVVSPSRRAFGDKVDFGCADAAGVYGVAPSQQFQEYGILHNAGQVLFKAR
jgi:hypothetical protein